MHFVCSKCKGIVEGTVDSIEKLCDEVETVNGFCYLEDRLNSSRGCEVAVTARVKIGWIRFKECGELLLENRFPLRIKGKVYRCCVKISNTVWKRGIVFKRKWEIIFKENGGSYGDSHVRSESCRQEDD